LNKKLKYTKYELSTENEIFIGFSTVTTVTADSHILADSVDTDCLTVAPLNKYYCSRSILTRQLISEQQSQYQNARGSHAQLQQITFPAQELTPQAILISQPFFK
jgi:hypothetical protein